MFQSFLVGTHLYCVTCFSHTIILYYVLECHMHYISDPRACYISDPPSQVSMTLNANQGNEVVHENQRVTFDCTAGDGRPTPTVRLVSRANGTEVHSELSPLTYSVMARCEDSGVYVCTARNGMGTQEVSVTASLTVQCECAEIISVWL